MTKPSPKDIRWQQRLENYSMALNQLRRAVSTASTRELSDLENQGMIQSFEFTHELAWKTIEDFYEHQGESNIQGSRDATRLAFQRGLLEDGDVWMDMIKSRNRTSHTYNETTAQEINEAIQNFYFSAFTQLEKALNRLKDTD